MFRPSISITQKILNTIVALELSDLELKIKYRNLIFKYENKLTIDIIKNLYKINTKFTYKKFNEFISGGLRISELTPLKNAYQAVAVFDKSMRAEDDWNLLIRLNQLIGKETSSIQDVNIRGKQPEDKQSTLSLHTLENSDQVKHFTIELLRWYRKSEDEINKYIRVFTLIYHLLKTFPFKKNNLETIMIALDFWLRENNVLIIKTLPLASIIMNLNNLELNLNEFLSDVLGRANNEANGLLFNLEKSDIEAKSTRKILNLSQRQIDILKILQVRDKIVRMEIADAFSISVMTAYRDIKGLVKKRLLVEKGVGRGTYYVLSSKVKKRF